MAGVCCPPSGSIVFIVQCFVESLTVVNEQQHCKPHQHQQLLHLRTICTCAPVSATSRSYNTDKSSNSLNHMTVNRAKTSLDNCNITSEGRIHKYKKTSLLNDIAYGRKFLNAKGHSHKQIGRVACKNKLININNEKRER